MERAWTEATHPSASMQKVNPHRGRFHPWEPSEFGAVPLKSLHQSSPNEDGL